MLIFELILQKKLQPQKQNKMSLVKNIQGLFLIKKKTTKNTDDVRPREVNFKEYIYVVFFFSDWHVKTNLAETTF